MPKGGKNRGNKQQQEAAPPVPKPEAPPTEPADPPVEEKPAEKSDPVPQETVAADVPPKEAEEDPKEDKVDVVAAKTDKSENGVAGLLVELLSASHDVIDGYQHLNKVEGSKVFETRVPKILADLVDVSGFNEETLAELRKYLERAQNPKFVEKFEEVSSRGTPKVKDVVVDETNFDVLIGKLADFEGTCPKKNLNEQWKRLEESESFKTYLAAKPKPPPFDAPEVALLADSTAKCASLESAFKSLQILHKKTESALVGLWQHKTGAVDGFLEAKKQYLQEVQLLPQEIRAAVAEAEELVQEDLGPQLQTEHRQDDPQIKILKDELKISKEKIEELLKALSEKNDVHEKLRQTHEESLNQQANELANLKQKLNEAENNSKVLGKELQEEKSKYQQKCSELENSAQTDAKLSTLQQELDKLQEAHSILTADHDALKITSTDLNAQIAQERSARERAEKSLQESRSNSESSEQSIQAKDAQITALRADVASLQQAAANQRPSKVSTLAVSQARSEADEDELFVAPNQVQTVLPDRNVEPVVLDDAAARRALSEARDSPSEPPIMEGDVQDASQIDPTQVRNDGRVGDQILEAEGRQSQLKSNSQETPPGVQTTTNQSAIEGSGGISGESGLQTQPPIMEVQPGIKQQNQTQLQAETLPSGPTTSELQKALDEVKQENQKLSEVLNIKNTTLQELKVQITNLNLQLVEAKNLVEVSKSNETNSAKELKKLEAELEAKNAEINSLKAKITNNENQIENLQNSLQEVRSQITELKSEIANKSEEIQRLNSQLDQSSSRSSTLTDSQISVELSQQHANEVAGGNAGIFPEAEADLQTSNFSIATKPREALAVSQVIVDPPVSEGGMADNNETQKSAEVVLTPTAAADPTQPALLEAMRLQLTASEEEIKTLQAQNERLTGELRLLETRLQQPAVAAEEPAQAQVDVEALKAAHALDVSKLELVRAELLGAKEELEKLKMEKVELEEQVSQKQKKIDTLEHGVKYFEKEKDKFQQAEAAQLKIVQEKDDGLRKLKALLEKTAQKEIELENELKVTRTAYENQKADTERYRQKYHELKRIYGHKSSGTSTPAKTHSGGQTNSALESFVSKIDETEETPIEISKEAKIDLNEAAKLDTTESQSFISLGIFNVQKSLLETLFSHIQELLKQKAISQENTNLSLPVTDTQRQILDATMLQISQDWKTQKAQAPPQETVPATQESEVAEAEAPQTLSDVFDELSEQIEMLKEQKQSLSVSLETFLNLLKKLIPKVLGPSGLKPLEECCTIPQITEELANILEGEFSTKLDEIIASASSVASLNSKIAQCEKEITDLKKTNQHLQVRAERLSQVEKLLTSPRNTFSEQNPVHILQQVAAATETSVVNVEVWRRGLATGVAHVIKDLLRRILSVVPQLHTVNPKRNAPWINHLLDVMSGVSSETDALLSQLSSTGGTKSFEEFVQQLQRTVCRAGEGLN